MPPVAAPEAPSVLPTCRTLLRPLVTEEFIWAVEGMTLDRMKACTPGTVLRGPSLNIGDGVELQAMLYCNGDGTVAETANHACLVRPSPVADNADQGDVMIRSAGRSVTITVGLLWLLNAQDGRTVLCYEVNRNKALGMRTDGSPMDNAYLGFGFRISHTQLAQHAECALAQDTLLIKCRVTAATSLLTDDEPTLTAPSPQQLRVPPPSLAGDLAALLSSGQGADCCLVADGCRMPAHRCVLAARSPVLAARLRGALSGAALPFPGPDGALPELLVEDVAPPVLAALLRYIYSEQSELESGGVEEAQHLMVCADALGVTRLRALCEQRLVTALDVHSAAFTLVLADQHNAAHLRSAALAFVARHATAVLATEGWAHLVLACPALQAELIALLASQYAGRATEESAGGGRNVRQRTS